VHLSVSWSPAPRLVLCLALGFHFPGFMLDTWYAFSNLPAVARLPRTTQSTPPGSQRTELSGSYAVYVQHGLNLEHGWHRAHREGFAPSWGTLVPRRSIRPFIWRQYVPRSIMRTCSMQLVLFPKEDFLSKCGSVSASFSLEVACLLVVHCKSSKWRHSCSDKVGNWIPLAWVFPLPA